MSHMTYLMCCMEDLFTMLELWTCQYALGIVFFCFGAIMPLVGVGPDTFLYRVDTITLNRSKSLVPVGGRGPQGV